MWREVFVWCLVSSLVIHFVSGLLAWYSLGGHPIAVYALPSFIVAGFFTPLFAGTITSESDCFFLDRKLEHLSTSCLTFTSSNFQNINIFRCSDSVCL